MSSPQKVSTRTLLLILLLKMIPYSFSYGIQHIKLSVINFEDSMSENGLENKDIRNDHVKPQRDEPVNGNPLILEENSPLLEELLKSEFIPGVNGINKIGNKEPLQKEAIESHRNPNIDVIENRLGTDRSRKSNVHNDLNLQNVEKPDGKIALEAIPIKKELENERNDSGEFEQNEIDKNLKDKINKKKVSLGESPLHVEPDDEKTRKIKVIPIRNKTQEKTELDSVDSNDSKSLSNKKHFDTAKQSDVPPSTKSLNFGKLNSSKDFDSNKEGLAKESTTDDDGSTTQDGKGKKHFIFQSGLSQDALNAVSDSRNSQLNIDQNNAKEPLTVLESNKNYGEQKYIENSETNINTNLFLDHKLERREELLPDPTFFPCETTTLKPCETTTTCATTTTPCPTTTTECPTTTTPCPTTTTPCPTTTTECPTTTTPCPTTTTECPTTTTPCPTTTTECPTTTTPCPTTTTECPTTTTPCPTTTTPCPTTTTECPTTTTPCPTTTTTTTTKKPCESGTNNTQEQTSSNNGSWFNNIV